MLLPHTLIAPSHPHRHTHSLCWSLVTSLHLTFLCCSLTPSPSHYLCDAPSHPHPHTLTVRLTVSLWCPLTPVPSLSHSLCCSLTPSPSHSLSVLLPHTLTITLPPCVAPSHPHHHPPSLCCSLTLSPSHSLYMCCFSHPHRHTPSLCWSLVTSLHLTFLCYSLTPSPSHYLCDAPSHTHREAHCLSVVPPYTLTVTLLVLFSHTLTITLPVLLPHTLTITLSLCVAPSHPHPHPPSPSPSLSVLLPHTLTVTLYHHKSRQQYIGTLCVHFFPQPLCMHASPNVLFFHFLFPFSFCSVPSSFLSLHISDSSLPFTNHRKILGPSSVFVDCFMKQLSLVGRGGSEGAVQWPGMMEPVQQ